MWVRGAPQFVSCSVTRRSPGSPGLLLEHLKRLHPENPKRDPRRKVPEAEVCANAGDSRAVLCREGQAASALAQLGHCLRSMEIPSQLVSRARAQRVSRSNSHRTTSRTKPGSGNAGAPDRERRTESVYVRVHDSLSTMTRASIWLHVPPLPTAGGPGIEAAGGRIEEIPVGARVQVSIRRNEDFLALFSAATAPH